jgi:hypothetical protein
VWAALAPAVASDPQPLLALVGDDRRRAGAALVLLLRYQVAASLGRRPLLADLDELSARVDHPGGRGALLLAFGLSDPTTEVRGDAFLLGAAAVLRVLDPDLVALQEPIEAALRSS